VTHAWLIYTNQDQCEYQIWQVLVVW